MMLVSDGDSTYTTEYVKIETNKNYSRFCDEITSIIFEKETVFIIQSEPHFSPDVYIGKEFKTRIINYDYFAIVCSEKYCYITCRFYDNADRRRIFEENPYVIIESKILTYDTLNLPNSKLVYKTDNGIKYVVCMDPKADYFYYISVLNENIEEFDIRTNGIKFNYDTYLGKYFSDKKRLPGYTITFEENSAKRLAAKRIDDISLYVKLKDKPLIKIKVDIFVDDIIND